MRWLNIAVLSMVGIASFAGCATKPPPNELTDRACYLGVVTSRHLASVQQWAPDAHVGDLLISAPCDQQKTEDLLNEIRRLTR